MATLISTIISRARKILLESVQLVRPISPLVGPQGTPGATTYSYVVVAINSVGHSEASAVGTTTTGAAALTGVNFNRLTWTRVPRNEGYRVYRTVGGATQGLIATLATDVETVDDTGLAGSGATAPTDNTSGVANQFWTDDELFGHYRAGAAELWRAIIDLHEEHFSTTDITNVSVAASTEALAGVPADCFRVLTIEPRDITDSGTYATLRFDPADYRSNNYQRARARGTIDPSEGGRIYYAIENAGSPVAAPTIKIAPKLSTAVPLLMQYVPTLSATLALTDNNPIPGESDEALRAFIIAHALAKDREDRTPDANWLAIFSTEKKSICVAATPRQEQEPIVVPGIFDDYYDED